MTITLSDVSLSKIIISSAPVISGARLTYVITDDLAVSLNLAGTVNIIVHWGDGSEPEAFITSPQNHTYAAPGTYNVVVEGTATEWLRSALPGKLTTISSWGDLPLDVLTFYLESKLTSVPNNLPPSVRFLTNTFDNCLIFNQDLSGWDTSNVIALSSTFEAAQAFNQDLSMWNVSNVSIFLLTFANTPNFNGNISTWNTVGGRNMTQMFQNAIAFNQDLSGWNVSGVTRTNGMFDGATIFNGDISTWDTTNITNFSTMFRNARAFNQDVSGWDVSKGTNFANMFRSATSFNGDVMPWNTVSATGMGNMFNGASAYGSTQDLTGWHVPLVPAANFGTTFAAGSLLPTNMYPIAGTP